MPNYRRFRVPGGTYFFTINLLERRSDLLVRHIDALREAVRRTRRERPFHIDAWVVLPEHMHCVITLPEGDDDFFNRIKAIKIRFVRAIPATERRTRVRAARGGTGHLAAPLLGACDSQRQRLRPSPGLCPLQPRQTRLRHLRPGLAVLHLQSPGKGWAVFR
jgi:REP element-mobilizing transposase RayT